MAVSRTRNYACVVYPESAPKNWISILDSFHVASFISPLHEHDIDIEVSDFGEVVETPKKSHYHVMIMFDSVKTSSQAMEIFSIIGGVGCIPIGSTRGYARYMCHLDNPEKYQYDINDVRQFGGADYLEVISTNTDKYLITHEIIEFIQSSNIHLYCDLVEYASENNYSWFKCLRDSPTFWFIFLKSKGYAARRDHVKKLDQEIKETLSSDKE